MAELHPTTKEILTWAKRCLQGSDRTHLSVSDLLCGVFAVSGNADVASVLRDVLSCPPEEAVWPEKLVALRETAGAEKETDDKFPFEEDLRAVIQKSYKTDPRLAPESLIRNLLSSRHALVLELLAANLGGDGTPLAELAARFDDVVEKTRRLTEALKVDVLGQDPAITMLGSAFFRSLLGFAPKGPMGIFTFLGPPGVGKTLLAETFARELGRMEEEPYGFRRIDMGNYSTEQSHLRLFGVAGFFRDASPGVLTGYVAEHPRSVILLDEIEKAHESVLQALLAVLDTGEVEDKKLEKTVSFRECWLVLTTNLGHEFLQEHNKSGILQDIGHRPSLVFQVLASARRRREVSSIIETPPALPPEFVSRLSKGGAVVFRSLETRHLMQLVDHAMKRQIEEAGEKSGGPLPTVAVSDESKLLFLLSLLPNLDARRTVAQSENWAGDLLKRGYEELREVLREVTDTWRVGVECSDDAVDCLAEEFGNQKLRVLVVDDDNWLPEMIERDHVDFSPAICHVSSAAGVADRLRRFRADLMLLDLSIHEGPGSAAVDAALNVLGEVRREAPDVPVVLYSENPQDRGAFDKVVDRVLRRGGARGFIPCERNTENPLELEDFVARLRAVFQDVRFSKVVSAGRRAHRAANWREVFAWEAENGKVVCRLEQVRTQVVYRVEEQNSPIRFSGIPTETFADVVGLSRAKRRLAQVVDWLKQPDKLSEFGMQPPRGFLLNGPPGTGKTLLARALAGEAGLPFLALSAGELRSKWVGESEERIRELFSKAREFAPAIIFVDEVDGLGRSRAGAADGHSVSSLNQLLSCMDGIHTAARPVFVLAATNHAETLDAALKRPGRFDETIPIDLPNADARKAFFGLRLKNVPRTPDVDLVRLAGATAGCTPAELDRIVREGVYAVSADGRAAVSSADLETARRLVRFGAEREGFVVEQKARELTAWHEAGHAVVFLTCFPARSIDYLTIVPNERGALGFLAMKPEENQHDISIAQVKGEMAVALAGRTAERMVVDDESAVTSGASSDLERATGLAWHSITRWGFEPSVGVISVGALPTEAREAWAGRACDAVASWLGEAEQVAQATLDAERPFLKRVVEALLASESLDWDALAALREEP